MDTDDDIEMQEVFQVSNMPVQRPALTLDLALGSKSILKPIPNLEPKPVLKSALTSTPAANIEEMDIEIDNNIDPKAYNALFTGSNNREAGPSTSFESTRYKQIQEKSKKKPKKRAPSSPEP
jgi:hypothetical protein